MNYILVVIVGLEPTTYSVWRKCTAIVLYHHNHFRITLNNSYCAGTHTFRHCQVTDAVAATLAVLAPLNMILKWWMRLESNQQCQRRRIYSPLGLPIFLHIHFKNNSRLCELICILRLFVFSCPGSYDCSVTSNIGGKQRSRTPSAIKQNLVFKASRRTIPAALLSIKGFWETDYLSQGLISLSRSKEFKQPCVATGVSVTRIGT